MCRVLMVEVDEDEQARRLFKRTFRVRPLPQAALSHTHASLNFVLRRHLQLHSTFLHIRDSEYDNAVIAGQRQRSNALSDGEEQG